MIEIKLEKYSGDQKCGTTSVILDFRFVLFYCELIKMKSDIHMELCTAEML